MSLRTSGAAAAAMVAAVAVITAATAASAHSALLRSDPAGGAALSTAPAEVTLFFSEAPDPELSRVDVFDRSGARVDRGEIEPDGAEPETIRVSLPALDDGYYTVSWQALSTVDGHVTSGAFTFRVGDAADGDEEEEAAAAMAEEAAAASGGHRPGPLAVSARWLLYWGLALLLGWAVSAMLVFRGVPPVPPWAVLACWAVAAAGVVLFTLAEAGAVGASPSRLLASAAGARIVRLGVVVAATGVAAALALRWRGRAAAAALAVLTLAAMLAHAVSGHAGSPNSTRWLNISAQWLHLAGIGAWIGGLVWLLAGLRGEPDVERRRPVGRFSAVATVALALVVATGVLRSFEGVGSIEALRTSGYGQTLLVKLAVIVPLLALGAVNRFRNVPALLRDEAPLGPLRNAVRSEVAFAAVVFAVTGVLAGVPPPVDIAAHVEHEQQHGGPVAEDDDTAPPPDRGIVATGSDFGTSVQVTLHVDPGLIGDNDFTLSVVDFDSREPLEVTQAQLRFTIPERPDVGAALLDLEPTSEEGTWAGSGSMLAQPGHWRVVALVTFAAHGVEAPLEFPIGLGQEGDDAQHGATDGGGGHGGD